MADVSEQTPAVEPKVENEEPKEAAPAEDLDAMFDLSKKKKKKTKKTKSKKTDEDKAEESVNEADLYDHSKPAQYSHKSLLDSFYANLHEHNPELTERKRHTIKPPQLMRVGTKKTLWANFQEICKMMNRSPEHVLQFTLSELGTEGSIDGNQRLVIRGRYVPKYIESLLRKYITEYVTCQMCRSPNTTLTRDSVSRLHFVHCKDCGSSRSVSAIRSGFHAATRADRRAARK